MNLDHGDFFMKKPCEKSPLGWLGVVPGSMFDDGFDGGSQNDMGLGKPVTGALKNGKFWVSIR